jgi:hypothetical protein
MMRRREFLAGAAAAGVLAQADPPARRARVVPLFRSPDGNPNALETTREGLWIGEQATDIAYLVDWSGKVLRKVETESSNTSGIAYGGGFLWMGSNGHTRWRAPKTFRVIHQVPVRLDRAHGLAWAAPDAIWCMHSTERVIHKLDARDAGIGPDGKSDRSRWAGYVCAVEVM